MFEPMKPPFSYYGGKQRIVSKIIPYIPKHTVYMEPFCGSGTVLFKKPYPNINSIYDYSEFINDKNKLVYNFFNVLVKDGERLADYLSSLPMMEEQYNWSVKVCKGKIKVDDFDRAVAFFVNINQSFSCKLNGGWNIRVLKRSSQASWYYKTDLYPFIDRMKQVGVTKQPATKVIKQLDSPQTFFYCDPPYPSTEQGHYNGYTQQMFEYLITTLDSTQGSAMVSCYNQDKVFKLCKSDWRKKEIKATCSASGKGKVRANKLEKVIDLGDTERTEVIYVKLSSEKPREEIQKLYDSKAYDCFTGDEMFKRLTPIESI